MPRSTSRAASAIQVSPNITGLEWSLPAIDVASDSVAPGVEFTDLPNAVDPLVSAGAVIIVLAALAIFGPDRIIGSTDPIGGSGGRDRIGRVRVAVACRTEPGSRASGSS